MFSAMISLSPRAPFPPLVREQPVELGERKAVEPLDEGVAGRRDVLRELGPLLGRRERQDDETLTHNLI
jgi:hypothetical protein